MEITLDFKDDEMVNFLKDNHVIITREYKEEFGYKGLEVTNFPITFAIPVENCNDTLLADLVKLDLPQAMTHSYQLNIRFKKVFKDKLLKL